MSEGDPQASLEALLSSSSAPWSGCVHHFRTIPSTNAWLLARARSAPEWTVAIADEQTAGRGRQGHAWISPRGNLYLSVLLKPSRPLGDEALLPLAGGVAVAEALEGCGVPCELKWPNDVLVGGRKIAGILVEGTSSAGGLDALVLGVGVNLVRAHHEMPEESWGAATSAVSEGSQILRPAEVALAVLERVRVWYHALQEGKRKSLLEAWSARGASWWGRTVVFESVGKPVVGVAVGIDERGALRVRLEGGLEIAVLAGEIRELRLVSQAPGPGRGGPK